MVLHKARYVLVGFESSDCKEGGEAGRVLGQLAARLQGRAAWHRLDLVTIGHNLQ